MFKYFGVDLDYLTRNTQQLLDTTVNSLLVKTGLQQQQTQQSDNESANSASDSYTTSDRSLHNVNIGGAVGGGSGGVGGKIGNHHGGSQPHPLSSAAAARRQLPKLGGSGPSVSGARQLPMMATASEATVPNSRYYNKSSSPSPELNAANATAADSMHSNLYTR